MRALAVYTMIFSFLTLATPAPAAPATPDGAAQLSQDLNNFKDWHNKISSLSGQGLSFAGPINVAVKDSYYQAHINSVSVILANGFHTEIGNVVINATAADKAGEWIFSMALPKRMTVLDAAQNPVGDITLGRQRFSAAWVPSLNLFYKIDSEYSDIKMQPRDGGHGPAVSIADFTNTLDMTENTDKTWSGPHHTRIGKTLITINSDNETSMSFENAAADTFYKGLSLTGAETAQKKVSDVLENSAAPQAQVRAQIEDAYKNAAEAPDIFKVSSSLSNFILTIKPRPNSVPEGNEPPKPFLFSIPQVTSLSEASGLRNATANLNIKIEAPTINIEGIPDPMSNLLPKSLRLEGEAKNLPTKDIKAAFEVFAEASTMPAAGANDYLTARQKKLDDLKQKFDRLPLTMAGTGANVEIKNSFIKTANLTTALQGKLVANAASPLVAVGNITLALSGIDEVVKKYRAEVSKNMYLSRYLATVTALQVLGKADTNPDGTAKRVYSFDLTPEGKVLLNGIDATAVKGLMQQKPAPK